MELIFSHIPDNLIQPKPKRKQGIKIVWTPEMLHLLTSRFATDFNKNIAKDLGIGWRSVVRKARELGLEKVEDFHEITGKERGLMAHKVRKHSPSQMGPGFVIPNSEKHRFKKGHTPPQKGNPEMIEKIHKKRNELIARERLRIKYGLPQISKLKLV
jgi:hypothetical protein